MWQGKEKLLNPEKMISVQMDLKKIGKSQLNTICNMRLDITKHKTTKLTQLDNTS